MTAQFPIMAYGGAFAFDLYAPFNPPTGRDEKEANLLPDFKQ